MEGGCTVSFKGDIREPISFRMKRNDKEILDLEKFLKIATPSIDANPTPSLKARVNLNIKKISKSLPEQS